MRVIYADSMFLLNFTLDYLLLLAAGKICLLPLSRWRMALGAAWGGIYAVLSAVYPAFFALGAVKIAAGLGCAAIAFGGCGRFIRTAVVYFAVSAAFGGAVYAAAGLGGTASFSVAILSLSTRTLVLAFALCYALLSLVFRGLGRRGTRELGEITIVLRDRQISFTALRDTGCELTDSAGYPVLTAQWDALKELFPELVSPAADPAGLCMSLAALEGMTGRCRVLPCLTVTDGCGLLAAFRPDELKINGGRAPHRLVAISFTPLSSDGEYKALY